MEKKQINIDSFIYRRGICNALKYAGITTLQELVNYREDYIKNILFSNGDFEHLKEKIKAYNEQMRGARVEDDERKITKGMFSDRVYRALKNNGGVYTVEDIMQIGSKGLMCLHNIGREEVAEIKTKLIELGYLKEASDSKENSTTEEKF